MKTVEKSSTKVRSCFVRLGPISPTLLRSCSVGLTTCKSKQASKTKALSRQEKILLLPKKNGKGTPGRKMGVKGGRVAKKQGKFQLKIRKKVAEHDRASPDSGISSRPLTPDDEDDDLSDDQNETEVQDEDKFRENFIKSLDEGLDSSEDEEEEEDDWQDGKETKWTHAQKKKKQKFEKMELEKDDPSEKSEYEKSRDKNMIEREKMFAALKAQWSTYKKKNDPKPKQRNFTPRTPRTEFTGEIRRSGRTTGEKVEYHELDDSTPGRMKSSSIYNTGCTFVESEFRYAQREKPRTSMSRIDPNTDVLKPEDVTDSMLKKIHNGGNKVYCPATGTCCHQCRQKTKDTKTVCRSGRCIGLKGQFCGRCLNMRYGESVAEALMDPSWECPPCRGICNCSFCLETPTGQLFNLARKLGHASVHHYLEHLRGKWDDETKEEEEDEEDEEEMKEEEEEQDEKKEKDGDEKVKNEDMKEVEEKQETEGEEDED